ncbi:hypothetical protein SK128_004855 [Halocaridina rubra]|uniref:Uncharacterized protein n=1 Tax=Halocaridina rubra TaxID=373956 RepID=A0AAN9FUT7_HALRR
MAVRGFALIHSMALKSLPRLTSSQHKRNWQTYRTLVTAVQLKSSDMSNRIISGSGVWIEANPRVCLHDVPTELRAGGLPPNSPVTLTANLTDEQGKRFCSNAHYITNELGQIDASIQAAVGGSYTGVFPAGLLTTLAPAPEEYAFLRLYKRDPTIPWKISVSVTAGHTTLQEQKENLATIDLERHLMAEGVKRIPIREGRVRGTLYLPAGKGPFPGVIDMFGSVGGLFEFRAALLASRGIAALALAFFAYEDLPKVTNYFELEYFEEATRILLSQPTVIKDRCGVISVSKSSDIAYSMGTWLSPVKAVVGISGPPLGFDSDLSYKGQIILKGVKLAAEDMAMDKEKRIYPKREAIRNFFNPKFEEHMVPIENADEGTHFLVVASDDDSWNTDIAAHELRMRMEKFGKTHVEIIVYPGAGHMIRAPIWCLSIPVLPPLYARRCR